MTIRYIPTSNETVTVALSEALWNLSRPVNVQGSDTTAQMFGTMIDTQGDSWLEALEEFEIPVHPDAEIDSIAAILQPWIDSGDIPADTNENLAALIEASKGKQLIVYDAFPQFFKDQSKSQDDLIQLGLFPLNNL